MNAYHVDPLFVLYHGDALEVLKELPDESAHCCVTSPPYWGLRDYGTGTWEGGDPSCSHVQGRPGAGRADGIVDERMQRNRDGAGAFKTLCKCGAVRIDRQLGLERTPDEYVAKMVEVFREVRRVLRDDGTLWLNLGDSYAGSWGNYGGKNRGNGTQREILRGSQIHNEVYDEMEDMRPPASWTKGTGLKAKDLVGIPWRVAFALQSDGWYLRSDIIWHKPNPMPESVTDRPTKAHEYIFLLSKSERYWYDAEEIREPNETNGEFITEENKRGGWRPSGGDDRELVGGKIENGRKARADGKFPRLLNPNGRNKRSVWTVATSPYPEAHFATYPPDLIKPCILAGCPVGGIVLDPFAGSGTTGQVALELGRRAVLIELNENYLPFIQSRLHTTPGLKLA